MSGVAPGGSISQSDVAAPRRVPGHASSVPQGGGLLAGLLIGVGAGGCVPGTWSLREADLSPEDSCPSGWKVRSVGPGTSRCEP